MGCARCGSEATRRDGKTLLGAQRWRCGECRRRFTARSDSASSGCCFPDDLIALAVRWYVGYRLSYADVDEWLAERGFTVYRRVRRFLPLFGEAARAYRRPVGGKWGVDETTYCRLKERWAYLYRAIDQDGRVVDVYYSERRNAGAAEACRRRYPRAADTDHDRQSQMLPACPTRGPARRPASLLEAAEQRAGTRPRAPQAATQTHARLQAPDLCRHRDARTRPHPEPPGRLLGAHSGHTSAPAPRDRLAAPGSNGLARPVDPHRAAPPITHPPTTTPTPPQQNQFNCDAMRRFDRA